MNTPAPKTILDAALGNLLAAALDVPVRTPDNALAAPPSRDGKAIQAAIDDYLDGYELRADEGAYTPSKFERFLLDDCIAGLLAQDDILALLAVAPASPVSTVEQEPPAAYLTLDEEGSPSMLFFDLAEARTYCAAGEEPVPLDRRPAPAGGDARDAQRYRALHWMAADADRFQTALEACSSRGMAKYTPENLDALADAAISAQRQRGA